MAEKKSDTKGKIVSFQAFKTTDGRIHESEEAAVEVQAQLEAHWRLAKFLQARMKGAITSAQCEDVAKVLSIHRKDVMLCLIGQTPDYNGG